MEKIWKIHSLNPISGAGTALWGENYENTEEPDRAHAVMVRSASMQELELPQGLLAVARAGAGVNNIPLERCTEQGTVVFNTPGANANSVAELVLCGLLLGSRDVAGGVRWVRSAAGGGNVAKLVEKEKKRFAGQELAGKKLGVMGLGAVGAQVAGIARKLGMEVYGCDPYLSIDGAWHLDSSIQRVAGWEELCGLCDYVTLHVPLTDQTRGLVGRQSLEKMKDGAVVLNFARGALVDDEAMAQALKTGKVRRYITDFPNDRTAAMEGVVAIPHLGASTREAEDNCARMAVRQVMDYLENGNITNSVNFPDCTMGICRKPGRICILHRNLPNTLSRFTAAVARENRNISDLLNRSRGAYAVTMLDLDEPTTETLVAELEQMEGVLRVRRIR